ncbi:MAG: MBL fold metallo-hydrolase [Acidobacteriales bacterium]|nr:MBL fold metallo-hydrolase [Terriglobales bacterium]
MRLQRFEVPGLAHYSYVLSSEGKAVVVDPRRDVDIYTEYAAANDLAISHILETHIHADYASGARELAQITGAEAWMSGHDVGEDFQYRWPHRDFMDGEVLELGDMRITALHTPGHTPEHLSFLVAEKSRGGRPMLMLSGDFVFVGSLGRPDLLGEAAKRKLAGQLYDSVFEKIKDLPDGIEVHPAHGAGSLCGAGMSERPQSTLGYERLCNAYFADRDKAKFVEHILSTVPEFPEYYKRMKRVNSEGPALLGGIPGNPEMALAEFQRGIAEAGAVVIDLRRPEAFGGGHIPGSYSIGGDQNLASWAAWVVPYDQPIYLVGEENVEYHARRALVRVGHDTVRGMLKGGFRAWMLAGSPVAHVPQISVEELRQRMSANGLFLLDVRSPGEWKAGHVAGAVHIPGGSLPARVAEVPRDKSIHTFCGSGYRSSIATSVLRRAGRTDITNVMGGMTAWKRAGYPVVM